MVNANHTFHIADYSVFAVTIVVSLGIGLYYALSGGKQRTTSEYLVGNRQMMIIPVAISLMVSFESSIMMLGTPAEIYVYGLQWLIGNFGFLISNMLAIFVMVPLIHPLRITSAYEYLEMRFKSRAVRVMGTLLGMLGYAGYMGIVLFGPAIALEAVTGFPQWASIVAVAGTAMVYTAIGGLKAVIWTDVFQCVVMFAGFFAVLIKGTISIGGIGKTWTIAAEKGRVNFFNFDPDPTIRHTFWNLFVGSIIRGFGLVFNQSSVQRISSTPTVAAAKKVLLLTAPAFFISLCLAGIEGVIAYAYYDSKGCDPIASKQIQNPNQIIPYMVMEIFENLPGMPGLFMASLFSASLSTLSSGLSSLSALTWADLVKPHTKPMSEFRATVIAKMAVVFFALMSIGIAFGIAYVGGTLIQIAGSLLSAIGGPLTGLFMLGAFVPFANAKGAMVGTISSAIFTFIIAIGQMSTPGSVKNTKLPPGPTDFCPTENTTFTSDMILNSTLISPAGLGTSFPLPLPELAINVTSMAMGGSYLMSGSDMDLSTSAGGLPVEGVLAATAASVVKKIIPEPTGFKRLFMLSYQWFGTVGILWTMIIGAIVSLITGQKFWCRTFARRSKPDEVDQRTLIPFYDKFLCCLPESILKLLRCGFDYSQKPAMNGEYSKVNVLDEYEITLDDPKKASKLESMTVLNQNNIAGPHIHQSFDDLLVPKFNLADKEYEIIDLRKSAREGLLKSHDTHIIIDRTVGSVIKLRSKSIEIDVPATVPSGVDGMICTEVPSVEIIPPTPEDEGLSSEPRDDSTLDHPDKVRIPNGSKVTENDLKAQEMQNCKNVNPGDAVIELNGAVKTADAAPVDVDSRTEMEVNRSELEDSQDLDNIQTVDLDEDVENTRTYGIAIVLNGKEHIK